MLIDPLQAQIRLGHQTQLLFKLIDIVIEDVPIIWTLVAQTAADGELPTVAAVLHNLKGIVANFSTSAFVEQIEHLEAQAGQGVSLSVHQLSELHQQVLQFQAELLAYRKTLTVPGTATNPETSGSSGPTTA